MDIKFKTEKFAFSNIDCSGVSNLIIFDCTDNLAARASIEESVLKYANFASIIISCGNEEDFGQVLYSCYPRYTSNKNVVLWESLLQINTIENSNKTKITDKTKFNLSPSLLSMYPNFKDTEKPSCTEIQLVDDQSMPINSTVAQLAYNLFYLLVSGQDIDYHMVKCNNANLFTTNSVATKDNMKKVLIQGMYGDYNNDILSCIDEVTTYINKNNRNYYSFFSSLIEKYSVYLLPIIDYYRGRYGLISSETSTLIEKIKEVSNANISN